jgi:hypothetical protein
VEPTSISRKARSTVRVRPTRSTPTINCSRRRPTTR